MSCALDASVVVSNCLRTVEPSERREVLCSLMAHAAAGLTAVVGIEKAAEACYSLADAVVSREASER